MAFSAHRIVRRAVWISCIGVLGVSCSSHRIEPTTVAEREIPLELHWVKSSAEYKAICLQTYALAEKRLEELVRGREPGTWAVSFDADETVLDNSSYQVWLSETGETYDRANWQAWARLEEAAAVPGARDLMKRVGELGGKVAIVTNRREPICAATESNIETLGLPYDVILCRVGESSKEPRWQSIEKGEASPDLGPLEIVMWFGDNIHDFPGWSQSRRSEPKASFGDFGSRFFVLPNPLYGSFEDNAH